MVLVLNFFTSFIRNIHSGWSKFSQYKTHLSKLTFSQWWWVRSLLRYFFNRAFAVETAPALVITAPWLRVLKIYLSTTIESRSANSNRSPVLIIYLGTVFFGDMPFDFAAFKSASTLLRNVGAVLCIQGRKTLSQFSYGSSGTIYRSIVTNLRAIFFTPFHLLWSFWCWFSLSSGRINYTKINFTKPSIFSVYNQIICYEENWKNLIIFQELILSKEIKIQRTYIRFALFLL